VKIVFFKNESHFVPRLSYLWENAELVGSNSKLLSFKKLFEWGLVIPLFVMWISYSKYFMTCWPMFFAILLLALPVHEFCHVLFCWLMGRKIERIAFFPYKQILTRESAYVRPSFGVWNKLQTILFFVFPLILLSVIPGILAIFFASIRLWLIYISLLGLSMSSFDIDDTIRTLKLPKNVLCFLRFNVTVKDPHKPVVIHEMWVTSELDKIHHRCYQYFNGRLTEIEQTVETAETQKLKQEFIKQFNLKNSETK